MNGQFLEHDTFKYSPLVDDKGKDRPSIGGGRIPSADGTVYTAWNTNQSPSSSTTFVIEAGVVKRYEGGEYLHAVPGPDGRTMFTGKGIAGQTLKRGDADANYGYCLPAVRGEYFLSLTTSDEKTGGGFVTAEGVVTWAVPADATGAQDVILTVRDKAGPEVFHSFTLTVVK